MADLLAKSIALDVASGKVKFPDDVLPEDRQKVAWELAKLGVSNRTPYPYQTTSK